MLTDQQTIKELKAILRTPRLYEIYRKHIEKAINEEVARKAIVHGDLESMWNTIQTVDIQTSHLSDIESIGGSQLDPGLMTRQIGTRQAESLFENQEFQTSKIKALIREKNFKPSTAQANIYNGTNKRTRINGAGYKFALMASSDVRKTMEQKKGWTSSEQTGASIYRAPIAPTTNASA